MSSGPQVSVVLPCYDVERFVGEALESLLAQTHRDLEIVAVDDGSRDGTLAILERYAARDNRVRLLLNHTNLGLISTLNRAVEAARGSLIARMDADSIARPDRIERQVAALAARPDVSVVGSNVTLVAEDGRSTAKPRPVRCFEAGGARFMLLFANPLAHVTILCRADVMKRHPYGGASYSLHTEDYELFTRMAEDGVQMMNLSEPLVTVYDRQGGVSWSNESVQVVNFIEATRWHLRRTLQLELAPGSQKVLVNRIDETVRARDLVDGLRWLARLERMFIERESDGARADIRRVADLQRVDILAQAALKASPLARSIAPVVSMRYLRVLGSSDARQYLVTKLLGSPVVYQAE